MHLVAPTRVGEVRLYRRRARKIFWVSCTIGVLSILAGRPVTAQAPVPTDIQAALQHTTELMRTPMHVDAQFDYIMTARVRFLLFWAGKDDVGGGYIRRGRLPQAPAPASNHLLLGS